MFKYICYEVRVYSGRDRYLRHAHLGFHALGGGVRTDRVGLWVQLNRTCAILPLLGAVRRIF